MEPAFSTPNTTIDSAGSVGVPFSKSRGHSSSPIAFGTCSSRLTGSFWEFFNRGSGRGDGGDGIVLDPHGAAAADGGLRDHLRGSILWRQAPGSHRAFRLAVYLCQHCGRVVVSVAHPAAGTLFHLVGHSQAMQKLEAEYFVALCYSGMPTALVAAASRFSRVLATRRSSCASTWWGSSPTRFSTMC